MSQRELDRLYAMRDYIDAQIRIEQSKLAKEKSNTDRNGKRDHSDNILWTQTSQLSPYVKEYLKLKGTSIDSLAIEANISASTIKRIRDESTQWTKEATADILLQAMDMPHVYQKLTFVRLVLEPQKRVPEPPPTHYFEE